MKNENISKKAIEFCLPNQDGIQICLRDFSQKWIILYFYPKDSTPGCTTQACDFTQNLDFFENLNAVIIGISPDSAKKHQNFIAKQNLKHILLSDEEKTTIQDYGVWQKKKMCGREYMGVVRSTFIINPQGEIVKEYLNVKVKNHVNLVKDDLQALQGN